MANTAKTNTADSGRNTAFLSILLSIVGIIVGYIGRGVGTSGFSAGMVLTFVALLLSLTSVENHGKNAVQMVAFFLAVVAMFFAVGICAVSA
ncbi:MAG: hypothetical protein PUC99_11495 [Eubacteriales bacterium]|jgi:hypothetical protein|nr:hypothetical protein [Lachnospiraceae bacterium]MDD5860935.1 hypothetical protein [Eubacteriales bacterium]MCH4063824.1 hypothetical protein [Lachnospiraceae bacterium]MCH4103454.1 hypothetical protein [Lachnospiraceae bacterium]MCI1310110.1 hypothetical protein [Lachnospiraceae bacterium]